MDSQLVEFIHTVRRAKGNEKAIFEFEPPTIAELSVLAALSGQGLSGFRRVLDSFAVRHIFKNHGNGPSENNRGQIVVVPKDFLRIPEIVKDFDERKLETNRIGNQMFIYKKELGDFRMIYAEEIRAGRRELAADTL